jgi:hypothetical protein
VPSVGAEQAGHRDGRDTSSAGSSAPVGGTFVWC